MGQRKSIEAIVDSIFDVLKDKHMHSVDEVASRTGSNWRTVDRWLRLIVRIQGKPTVKRERSGRYNLYWIPWE